MDIHCSTFDLYSKSKVCVDVEAVKPYYQALIQKVQFLSLLACFFIQQVPRILSAFTEPFQANFLHKNFSEVSQLSADLPNNFKSCMHVSGSIFQRCFDGELPVHTARGHLRKIRQA